MKNDEANGKYEEANIWQQWKERYRNVEKQTW